MRLFLAFRVREGELLGLHYVRVPENGGSMAVASCKCVSARMQMILVICTCVGFGRGYVRPRGPPLTQRGGGDDHRPTAPSLRDAWWWRQCEYDNVTVTVTL